jgi:hypothetical protein
MSWATTQRPGPPPVARPIYLTLSAPDFAAGGVSVRLLSCCALASRLTRLQALRKICNVTRLRHWLAIALLALSGPISRRYRDIRFISSTGTLISSPIAAVIEFGGGEFYTIGIRLCWYSSELQSCTERNKRQRTKRNPYGRDVSLHGHDRFRTGTSVDHGLHLRATNLEACSGPITQDETYSIWPCRKIKGLFAGRRARYLVRRNLHRAPASVGCAGKVQRRRQSNALRPKATHTAPIRVLKEGRSLKAARPVGYRTDAGPSPSNTKGLTPDTIGRISVRVILGICPASFR